MTEEISCVYCGHPNPGDALFCQACSRVLEEPGTQADQQRKTYLDQKDALVTETTAFLYGKSYPIAEIQEVEIIDKPKDKKAWGVGLLVFGVGTILEGLFDGELIFAAFCGLPSLLFGGLLVLLNKPQKTEEMVSTLWITTADGKESSLVIEDEAEALAIRDAVQQSCSDQGGESRSADPDQLPSADG